jgi:CheY-like chemotaxis protein
MPTVLIADDEPSLRLLIRSTLASDRLTVLEASDGDEAWVRIRERQPAVALLDVQMPGLSGLEVCRLVRADPTLASTRVILLSARALAQDREAGLAAGASAYLAKPCSPAALLAAVEAALAP